MTNHDADRQSKDSDNEVADYAHKRFAIGVSLSKEGPCVHDGSQKQVERRQNKLFKEPNLYLPGVHLFVAACRTRAKPEPLFPVRLVSVQILIAGEAPLVVAVIADGPIVCQRERQLGRWTLALWAQLDGWSLLLSFAILCRLVECNFFIV